MVTTRSRQDDIDALERLAGGTAAGYYAKMSAQQATGSSQLTRWTQQYLYRRFGILKKLVNIPADQMTFRWGKLQLGGKDGDAEIIEAFEKTTSAFEVKTIYSKTMGLAQAFNLAMKRAYKTGNGAILLDVDDGEPLDQPINYKRLKSIRRLIVLDRWMLYPLRLTGAWDTDYFRLGGLASSRISLGDSALQAVHSDRVLWFRGEELDDDDLSQTNGCDDSVYQSVITSFFRYEDAICGARDMIRDFDVLVHKIQGLLSDLEQDGDHSHEQLIARRIETNDQMSRIHRTRVIDLEHEDLVHSSRTVGGYKDLLVEVLNDFLANQELTPSELLERYPEGMADTGKVEQQNANDRTSRYQAQKFDGNMRRLCEVLFQCKEQSPTKGKIPDSHKFVWEPLYPVTPPEQAELQLNYAQIDDTNIRNGVYTGDDVAHSRYGSSEFATSITIDWKRREQILNEKKQMEMQQASGFPQEGDAPAGKATPEDDIDALLKSYQSDSMVFLPPPEVRQAAQAALKERTNRGIRTELSMTPLANRIATGQPLQVHDVRAMNLFFNTPKWFKASKQPLDEGYGAIVWLMYGGDLGKQWSTSILREVERRVPGGPRIDSVDVLAVRVDDDTPIKRSINWNQYQIGLQYEALDERHGKILPMGYGEFLGVISDHDGMNCDVYVGNNMATDRVFAITQLDHRTGEFDEVKFVVGVDKPIDEVAKVYQSIMTPGHFGGIEEISNDAITSYQPRLWLLQKSDASTTFAQDKYVRDERGRFAAKGGGSGNKFPTIEGAEYSKEVIPEDAVHLNAWAHMSDGLASMGHTQFEEHGWITKAIQYYAQTTPGNVRVVLDKNGMMQSAASIKVERDHIWLENLVTAPWNIPTKGLSDPRSVRGAGRKMIEGLVQEAIDRGMSGRVHVAATVQAIPFYEALGFRQTPGTLNHELTAEAAQRLLAARRDAVDWGAIDDLELLAGGILAGQRTAMDGDSVQVKGKLLSEKEWESLANVSEADAEKALRGWKRSAPDQFSEILESKEVQND